MHKFIFFITCFFAYHTISCADVIWIKKAQLYTPQSKKHIDVTKYPTVMKCNNKTFCQFQVERTKILKSSQDNELPDAYGTFCGLNYDSENRLELCKNRVLEIHYYCVEKLYGEESNNQLPLSVIDDDQTNMPVQLPSKSILKNRTGAVTPNMTLADFNKTSNTKYDYFIKPDQRKVKRIFKTRVNEGGTIQLDCNPQRLPEDTWEDHEYTCCCCCNVATETMRFGCLAMITPIWSALFSGLSIAIFQKHIAPGCECNFNCSN